MNFRYLIGGVLVLIGLGALMGINLSRFIGPLFLIWLGWLIITRPGRNRRWWREDWERLKTSDLNETLVFTGARWKVESDDFRGGKLTAVFGGLEADLSGVRTKAKELDLELTAVFGGINIKLPKNWKVESEAVGLLGGIDKRIEKPNKPAVTVRLTGAAVFGGVEIRN